MPEIILKTGREKALIRRHPWIFSGAIAEVKGTPEIGETVDVRSSTGEFLARAAYSPRSNIVGRVWTWDENEALGERFFEGKIAHAIDLRQKLCEDIPSNALRLIHAESDGIPGLILDYYNEVYVAQFLTAGVERWKSTLIDIIHRITHASVLYERSDVDVRQLEGLQPQKGLLFGESLVNPVEIVEHGIRFFVDIFDGHKTGFYLDQRDNRLIAQRLSVGKKVLDCFSYTGGFALNCLVGGAISVTLVESSHNALEMAKRNILLNNLPMDKVELIEQDVFKYLRTLRDRGETFDMIILDPPKFAPTVSQIERASRGYKDINLMAFKILRKGGFLLTFSCSGGVNEDLFQKIVAGAALDAGVNALIIKRLHQAPDHPVALNFPESAYLKGFLIAKID